MAEVVFVKAPKKKFSWLKAIGKGVVTVGKGALVLAPIIADEVVPVLQGSGIKISSGIIVVLGVLKVLNNHRKNKDNGTPNEKND